MFERLIDTEPQNQNETIPFRTLEVNALRDSVRLELERLLNTRLAIREEEMEQRELTTVDYGIPDFSNYSPANSSHRRRIGLLLQQIIPRFEPRLKNVKVLVEQYEENQKALFLTIEGDLVVKDVWIPISFPILRNRSGEFEVYED